MDRKEYTTCMTPHMKGTGKTKEQRQKDMCIGAKLCTGKAANEQEAAKLCAEAALNPKPKAEKTKRAKFCSIKDLEAVSACVAENIVISALTPENIHQVFTDALKKCSKGMTATVKKAKVTMEGLDPQQLEAIKTVAHLQKQFEGKQW